jgi:hypothetical protein
LEGQILILEWKKSNNVIHDDDKIFIWDFKKYGCDFCFLKCPDPRDIFYNIFSSNIHV